jgi:hypothetical protein
MLTAAVTHHPQLQEWENETDMLRISLYLRSLPKKLMLSLDCHRRSCAQPVKSDINPQDYISLGVNTKKPWSILS